MGVRMAGFLLLMCCRRRQSMLAPTKKRGFTMMTDMIATAPPVLAAGWAFLYLLFGGGIGGAFLLFIALKAFGR
jgi:hypothetical protein